MFNCLIEGKMAEFPRQIRILYPLDKASLYDSIHSVTVGAPSQIGQITEEGLRIDIVDDGYDSSALGRDGPSCDGPSARTSQATS